MPDADREASDLEDLRRLECRRCRAISEGDLPGLEPLLAAELSHTHVTGRTEDRATYLRGLAGRPRTTTRKDLAIRVYGDVAVLTGSLVNHFPASDTAPARSSEITALAVWVRRSPSWQMAAFAASGASGRR